MKITLTLNDNTQESFDMSSIDKSHFLESLDETLPLDVFPIDKITDPFHIELIAELINEYAYGPAKLDVIIAEKAEFSNGWRGKSITLNLVDASEYDIQYYLNDLKKWTNDPDIVFLGKAYSDYNNPAFKPRIKQEILDNPTFLHTDKKRQAEEIREFLDEAMLFVTNSSLFGVDIQNISKINFN